MVITKLFFTGTVACGKPFPVDHLTIYKGIRGGAVKQHHRIRRWLGTERWTAAFRLLQRSNQLAFRLHFRFAIDCRTFHSGDFIPSFPTRTWQTAIKAYCLKSMIPQSNDLSAKTFFAIGGLNHPFVLALQRVIGTCVGRVGVYRSFRISTLRGAMREPQGNDGRET